MRRYVDEFHDGACTLVNGFGHDDFGTRPLAHEVEARDDHFHAAKVGSAEEGHPVGDVR